MMARFWVTMTRLRMIRLFAALQRELDPKFKMSVINLYRGVGLVIGNCTSIMMARLGVAMTWLGMIMVRLFAALQRELELKFKCHQYSLRTSEDSVSSSVTARAS